ncbi:MFS transporter, partial [Enterobacter bugandensis]|uniref:MFS transporter n=1 Tax=Enterobacter bugandensis TaxID=881260 RepID=UPI0021CF07EB
GIFVLSALAAWFILPSVKRAEPVVDAPAVAQGSLFADKDVLLLFIASMLMWTCNTMYIIDMPLYITANLGLPERLAGLLMGTAAGLEIPIMLLAGYSVRRFGKRKIMLFAVLAGVLFYT